VVMDAVQSYTDHVSARNLERMRVAALAWFVPLSWALCPARRRGRSRASTSR